MSRFKLPAARYDRALATAGRDFYIEDELGNYWGTFRVVLSDPATPRYRAALDRLNRKYQRRKGTKSATIAQEVWAEAFAEMALIGWSDVMGADDKAIPFSKAAAIEFFSMSEVDDETGEPIYPTQWLLAKLSQESENILNFQPVEQTEAPEKN